MSDGTDSEADGFFERAAVGDRMITQGRTITEADVTNFAGVSGDFNHLHTDGARMADSAFGERIATACSSCRPRRGLIWQSHCPPRAGIDRSLLRHGRPPIHRADVHR